MEGERQMKATGETAGAAGLELLTTDEMGLADRLTIEGGTPGLVLMENAGRAVAQEVARRFPTADMVSILCGPGNNGGDGFVAARLLRQQGFGVRLGLLGAVERLKGDAAEMAARWEGPVESLDASLLEGADVVVDAIFGAGLTRPIDGKVADLVKAVKAAGLPVVAVDVPSGVDGTTGELRGEAVEARSTVTFFRRKPGHLLLPGRLNCGDVICADIGIRNEVLSRVGPKTYANVPGLWLGAYPVPRTAGHKYSRGHAVWSQAPPTGRVLPGSRPEARCGRVLAL